MSNFIIQFQLKTEKYQEDILNKRLEIGRKIYNSLVTTTTNRYNELVKTKAYRNLFSSLTKDKNKDKVIWKEINELYKIYNLNEYAFCKDVKPFQKHFKENIDSFTSQKIASQLWKSYEKLLYGNGNKVYYKKYNTFNSLEGKSNNTGIRFIKNNLVWNKLIIPVKIDYNNYYEYQALQNEICYCRIVRKYVKNKYKYYIQLILKGKPPNKIDVNTGEIKHYIGKGDVGLDIGTSTLAISSEKELKILELADKVKTLEQEKRKVMQKMDRSSRHTNPDNYNEDGTIKLSKKLKWIKSNRYLKCQNILKEIYRKQRDVRKYQHECLANHIISLGDKIYVEEMNFSGLQRRAKNTEKNDKGKFKRKKRFGKSIGNRAPSMLLTILDRKLSYYDNKLIRINTIKAKASQFNHFEETYMKKSLSKRWNYINDKKIQRDMYSAFLIMNINEDLENFDLEKCNKRFDNFYKLHNEEVERLKNKKNLSSIGI